MKKNHAQKGFALLFAVLLAALLLAVGLSIFNLSLKEVQISGAGRESQIAFYAADAGIECAIYWDGQVINGQIVFATSTPGYQPNATVECGGIDIVRHSFSENNPDQPTGWSVNPAGNKTTFAFQLIDGTDSGINQPCVEVSVEKGTNGNSAEMTTIRSSGRNTCDIEARRVERGLVAVY